MPTTNSTLRLILALSLVLGVAIAGTGFVSSQYRREKTALGQSHYERGQALEKRAELGEAIEEYRKALIFCPDTADYRLSFASSLIEAGHLDEAKSHIDQLLQEDPTNGELNLMLGRIEQQRGQVSKAIEYYQRAVYEYWPPDRVNERRKARLELVDLLARSGRREELIGELMTLYANAPSDTALRTRIGLNLLDHGATSEATQVFRELVRVAPKDVDAHRGLAQAYFSSGDFVSARHEFERTLRLSPKDGVSTNELKLTNAVVDLDPELAGISDAERLRRAHNLLRRVLTDMEACSDSSASKADLAKANELLNASSSGQVQQALSLQETATTLWAQRSRWCAGKPTSDGALATVIARITSE